MSRLASIQTPVLHAADAAAASLVAAAIMQWVPPLGAVLGAIWFAYQILDMWDRRRERKKIAQGKIEDHKRRGDDDQTI